MRSPDRPHASPLRRLSQPASPNPPGRAQQPDERPDGDLVLDANTKLALSSSTAAVAGPGIAGVLVGAAGAITALVADAITFIVSVVSLLAIRHRETAGAAGDAAGAVRARMRTELGVGLRFLVREPVLRTLVLCTPANLGSSTPTCTQSDPARDQPGITAWNGMERLELMPALATNKGVTVPAFPTVTHVALTVSDLGVSVPWYERLTGSSPALDEDTGPFHHTVFAIGSTLLGLHGFPGGPAAGDHFDERRIGLDHVAFQCANRGELEQWQQQLDELGIKHGGIVDAHYGSGLSFRDPDNIALEFFAPPA